MKKIELKTAFLLVIVLSGLISILGLSYFYFSLSEILIEKSIDHLKTAAESRAEHVETFLDGKKKIIAGFSSDPFIIDSLNLLKDGGDPVQIGQDLSWHLLLNKLLTDIDLYEVIVLDSQGIIVGASNLGAEEIGEDKSKSELKFTEGKIKPFISKVFYDKEFNKNAFIVSAPIRSRGKFLGVVVIKMELNTLFRITADRAGLGKTGEIYITNKEGYLLTPSRFLSGENKGILTQRVVTVNSEECFEGIEIHGVFNEQGLEGHSSATGGTVFKDYRGVNVLGAHSHITGQSWCLLAEIDESEALGAARNKLLTISLFILFAMSILYASMMYFAGKLFDKR